MHSNPFDAAAATYDHDFDDNPVTKALRNLIQSTMLEVFKEGSGILEINCGTGSDALFLASHGINVTATDVSLEMTTQAREKARRSGLTSQVEIHTLSFEELGQFEGRFFDGALSNFGGLNCTTDPHIVFFELSKLLRPGSPFILCVLSRVCFWEMAGFLVRGKFRSGFRRLRSGGEGTNIGNTSTRIVYPDLGEWKAMLRTWFHIESVYGLSICSPVPGARNFIRNHPRLSSTLLRFDAFIRFIPLLRACGDHTVIVARRKAFQP